MNYVIIEDYINEANKRIKKLGEQYYIESIIIGDQIRLMILDSYLPNPSNWKLTYARIDLKTLDIYAPAGAGRLDGASPPAGAGRLDGASPPAGKMIYGNIRNSYNGIIPTSSKNSRRKKYN